METELDERTREALAQIQNFGRAATVLVRRGEQAYDSDGMLRLAGEAILRRLDDAVAGLEEDFLAVHPEVDWASMRMVRGIREGGTRGYQEQWGYLSTGLPKDLETIERLVDAWWWRPLPGPGDGAVPPVVTPRGAGEVRDADFRALVQRLDAWTVGAYAPGDDGPIDVVLPDGRAVRIVMTARDLANMHVVQGTLDGCLISVACSVRRLPEGLPYLVYGSTYSLESSPEPTPPPSRLGPR